MSPISQLHFKGSKLVGELFISAGGDTRGESRWTRPFKGAGGLGEGELAEWCLFQKMPELLQPGGRTQVWAPLGEPLPSLWWLLLSSPVGEEAEGRSPVAAESGRGFSPATVWLKPCRARGFCLSLVETVLVSALVRRMRGKDPTAGPRTGTPPEH